MTCATFNGVDAHLLADAFFARNAHLGCALSSMMSDTSDLPPDYVIMVVNARFEALTGLCQSRLVGQPLTDMWMSLMQTPATWLQTDHDLVLAGGVIEFEHYAPRRQYWYHVSSYSPHSGYLVTTLQDITERKRREIALQANEARYRALFETISDGIVLHDYIYNDAGDIVNYRIVEANAGFEKMTGISRAHVVGKLATDAYGTEQAPYLDKYCQVDRGQHISFTTYFPPLDKHFSIKATQPGPGQFTTLFQDITDRVRREEQEQQLIAQALTLRELSTPLIPLSNNIVVMPLVGTIDTWRAQQIMEALLTGVAHHAAETVIIDITGIIYVDTQVAQALMQAAQAVRLLGAQVMLTGVQPQMALTLIQLGIDLQGIITHRSLQAGIDYARSKRNR